MGFLDWMNRPSLFKPKPAAKPPDETTPWDFSAATSLTESSSIGVYENTALTVRGEPTGYDFEAILRDPQGNIDSLYRLSAYYKEGDPMYGGSIKNVYVPFSVARAYRLVGASEATKQKYQAHYDSISFRDKMVSIFDQLYTFANVFVYLMPDGNIVTLPPTRCRIAEVCIGGEPIIEYNIQDIMQRVFKNGSLTEKYLKSFESRLKGLPPEVAAELKKNNPAQWVQLDPENVFALQAPKPDWTKYAPPPVLPCLNALSRKALIGEYEKAQLQFGIKGFLHVKVGDKDKDSGMNAPNKNHIAAMYKAFEVGLKGGKQVVTPWYVDARFVTVDTKTLFDKDKYAGVNAEILSACGISGVVVNGQQESGSYGEARLSLETVALRIKQCQDNFAEMMNKINARLAERLPRVSAKNIPKFDFPAVDLTNDGKFAEAVFKLWQQGMASNQTLLDAYGLDIVQELERKKTESANGQDQVFTPPQNAFTSNTSKNTTNEKVGGRPKKPEGDRISDPEKSETGAQPKPSNPDGS